MGRLKEETCQNLKSLAPMELEWCWSRITTLLDNISSCKLILILFYFSTILRRTLTRISVYVYAAGSRPLVKYLFHHGLPPVRAAPSHCVFLYLLHGENQTKQFSPQSGTFLESEDIFAGPVLKGCLRMKTWFQVKGYNRFRVMEILVVSP